MVPEAIASITSLPVSHVTATATYCQQMCVCLCEITHLLLVSTTDIHKLYMIVPVWHHWYDNISMTSQVVMWQIRSCAFPYKVIVCLHPIQFIAGEGGGVELYSPCVGGSALHTEVGGGERWGKLCMKKGHLAAFLLEVRLREGKINNQPDGGKIIAACVNPHHLNINNGGANIFQGGQCPPLPPKRNPA